MNDGFVRGRLPDYCARMTRIFPRRGVAAYKAGLSWPSSAFFRLSRIGLSPRSRWPMPAFSGQLRA